MATYGYKSHLKHRRSTSPEDPKKSSKRHTYRYGSRKHDEEIGYDGKTVPAVPSPILAPNSPPKRDVLDDDVEEGEILEVEGGEVGKKQIESDSEPGETEVTGDLDVRSNKENSGLNTKNSETRSKGISVEKSISPVFDGEDRTCRQSHIDRGMYEDDSSPKFSSADPQDGKDARASTDVVGNGHLIPKSSKREKRHSVELGCYKANEKVKGNYDDGRKVNYHGNSSSESGGEKYRSGYHDKYRSRSRSNDHARDRSHSRSIVEEYRRHGEQGYYSYAGRPKSDTDLDDERTLVNRSKCGHVSRDLVREHSASYHSQEAWDRSEDKDVDRDLQREKKQERGRNREVDRVCRREKERRNSCERHRRDAERGRSREREDDRGRRREKERDRSWETVSKRDRRREKQRDRSRDRTRGDERYRVWDSRWNDRNQERDKIKEREKEKQDDRNRHKYRDVVNGKDEHLHHEDSFDSRDRYRRHSRHEETEWHHERKRNSDPVKFNNSMGSTLVDDENKQERDEDEQDDLYEKVTLQLLDQEEEDLSSIKEESSRRREAILEKYKKQVEQTTENEGKDKQTEEVPPAMPESLYGQNNDVSDAEISFSVGKSPPKNGNIASSKTSGAGSLGEGTPKGERSDDKFCDDIFGETLTGVWKLGKGNGLWIERGGLHDN